MQRSPAVLIRMAPCNKNNPPPPYLGHSDTPAGPLAREETGGPLRQSGQSLGPRGQRFGCASALTPALSDVTLISKEVIQGRISRRTKNSSGVSDP